MARHASQRLSPGSVARRAGLLGGTFAALLVLLLVAVRPWYTSWGSSERERSAAPPGDVSSARAHVTRAIDIRAPAERVFAFVSQLGQDRAGFYSYEWLEDLVGCEMPNLEHLDPRLQRWSVGDKLWMYPPGKLQGLGHATLIRHEPGRALVFGTRSPALDGEGPISGTWAFIVEPTGPQSSRLIVQSSGAPPPGLLGAAFKGAIFEPLHFAMERRMLEGIRGLAEGRPVSKVRDGILLASWALAFAMFLAGALSVLAGARWRRALLLFAAAGIVFQLLTFVQPAAPLALLLVSALVVLGWAPILRLGRMIRSRSDRGASAGAARAGYVTSPRGEARAEAPVRTSTLAEPSSTEQPSS